MRRQHIIFKDKLPITISYLNIKNYPIHWHNAIEIVYVLQGSVDITVDADTFTLNEKELEIINVDESHKFYSSVDNRILVFHMDSDFFEKYYKDVKNVFFYTNVNKKHDLEYNELKVYLTKLLCEYVQKHEDFDEFIEDLLIDLLYHLINNFHYLTYDKEELKDNMEQLERYHRIAKYIFNNYDSNITLQDIANKEFLSTHYLSHEIKYATGYSFTDLINLTRVEESTKLLLDTEMSISEISDQIGFSHIRYFNKNFKLYYNLTTLQYRKKYFLSEEDFQSEIISSPLDLEDSLKALANNIEDYHRFNFENKLWKYHIDMEESGEPLNFTFNEAINLGEAFDLLIEENKDILEESQEEIHFKYGRVQKLFHTDMGIFKDSEFYNWNKVKVVLEFLADLSLKPLIVIDNMEFSIEKYTNVLKSFYQYFNDLDYFDVYDCKFQFSKNLSLNTKISLKLILIDELNFSVEDEDFNCENSLNPIFDTSYMLPYIIHNSLFENTDLDFLRCFDLLEKATNITNEVFIGAPGIVNDMGIRKPSYYAYYLMSKLGKDLILLDDGCIVTKDENFYAILLYSHNDDVYNLSNIDQVYLKSSKRKSFQKKYSLNIVNVKFDTRITTYELNERSGSSFDYWLSMGAPKLLNKEEKEILYQASYPRIEFKYSKKSSVMNIITELKGYGAKLILLKIIK